MIEPGLIARHVPTGASVTVCQVERCHVWIRPEGGGQERRVPIDELVVDSAIAAGMLDEARAASDRLVGALAEANIVVPGLAVDGRVWDSPRRGPVRVVSLGHVTPETAQLLAGLIELAVRAQRITAVVRARTAA